MRLANEESALQDLGVEVVAASVDSPGRNEALRRRWHLPFPIVSDPDGELLLKRLDAWNAERGWAWPTLILLDPGGEEAYRMRSRDFTDRPTGADLFPAAVGLRLRPVELPPAPVGAELEEDPSAFRTEAFGHYFRGLRSGTTALAGRLRDDADIAETVSLSEMAASFLAAWKKRRQEGNAT